VSLEISASSDIFVEKIFGGARFLVCLPLWKEGFVHGFGGSEGVDFELFKKELSITNNISCKQVHGITILDINLGDYKSSETYEADGILGLTENSRDTNSTCIYIKTADCVPLIMIGPKMTAVVHAGWRGLASGIVKQALDLTKPISVIIGPCARDCCYEVGNEVIEAMSGFAAYKAKSNKLYLSTGQTASNIINSYNLDNGNTVNIFDCNICTICDTRFNSYRRQRDFSRNINFALVKNPTFSAC